MASIHVVNLLGPNTLPDTSGNVYWEPASVIQSNDRYSHGNFIFKDTSTRDTLGGVGNLILPTGFTIASAVVRLKWFVNVTTGNVRLEFDYTSIADGESADPSSDQESVASTIAVPGTAKLYKYSDISVTGSNFADADLIQFRIARDGAEAGPLDTAASSLYLAAAALVFTST